MNTKTTVISQAELENQFAYCDKIAAYWQSENIVPKAYVETYGCQQNEADSEKLRGYLSQSGYAIAQEAEGADVVIMNTCAIREHAEQRVFGNLGCVQIPSPGRLLFPKKSPYRQGGTVLSPGQIGRASCRERV